MCNKCPFLMRYKMNSPLGVIYKCRLADCLLRSKHLKEQWACKGCSIPETLVEGPCKYLIPCKDFIIRGSSVTWYVCDLFNIVIQDPTDFCKHHCKAYEMT